MEKENLAFVDSLQPPGWASQKPRAWSFFQASHLGSSSPSSWPSSQPLHREVDVKQSGWDVSWHLYGMLRMGPRW